jgi:Na+/proline symporter
MSSALLSYGIIVVFAFALMWWLFGLTHDLDAKLVANRSIPRKYFWGWSAVAFTWGTTYLYTAMFAYLHGVVGVSFFVFGNTAGLVANWRLVRHIPASHKKYTLPESIAEQYDGRTGMLYALIIMAVQVGYALTLQFVVVQTVFGYAFQWSREVSMAASVLTVIVLLIVGGIRSSAAFDIMKAGMMCSLIFIMVPLAIVNAGGPTAVAGGILGTTHLTMDEHSLLWVLKIGVPVVITLLTAGVIDQSLYQRYFSTRETATGYVRLFILGGLLLFVLNMLASASLGLLAANPDLGVQIPLGGNGKPIIGLAGYMALEKFAPHLAIFLAITILASFLASGDTALNAASGVYAKDIYHAHLRPDASEKHVDRIRMLIAAVFLGASATAAYLGAGLVDLLVGMGVLRGAFFFPTVVAYRTTRENRPQVFWIILCAIAASVAVYAPGKYCEVRQCVLPLMSNDVYQIIGPPLGWAITGIYCAWKLRAPIARWVRSKVVVPAVT